MADLPAWLKDATDYVNANLPDAPPDQGGVQQGYIGTCPICGAVLTTVTDEAAHGLGRCTSITDYYGNFYGI